MEHWAKLCSGKRGEQTTAQMKRYWELRCLWLTVARALYSLIETNEIKIVRGCWTFKGIFWTTHCEVSSCHFMSLPPKIPLRRFFQLTTRSFEIRFHFRRRRNDELWKREVFVSDNRELAIIHKLCPRNIIACIVVQFSLTVFELCARKSRLVIRNEKK